MAWPGTKRTLSRAPTVYGVFGKNKNLEGRKKQEETTTNHKQNQMEKEKYVE